MQWAHDPNHPVSKVCSKCGVEKPFPEFYLCFKRGKRRATCKECDRARMRRYIRANREKVRAAKRRAYAEHVDERRAARRRRDARNHDRVLAAQRRWRRENPERVREWQRRYREANPRKVLVRAVTRGLRLLGLIEMAERCADCGGTATELHHLNYDDPFAVVSLCHGCHMGRHWAEWRRTGEGPVKYPCGEGRGASVKGKGGRKCRSGTAEAASSLSRRRMTNAECRTPNESEEGGSTEEHR